MWTYVKYRQKFIDDYLVEDVKYVDEMENYLKELHPSTIYLWSGSDSDSRL